MEVLTSDEIYEKIKEIVKGAKESVYLVSAWLTSSALEELFSFIPEEVKDFKVVLRASELQDLLITDEGVFELIKEKGGEIYLHPRLHAKFILVDGNHAVVGSANFTGAGLSTYEKGNVEAAVYYSSGDDIEEIERLLGYFERIVKGGEAVPLDDGLVGFAMNPVKSRSFEFILLDGESIGEQDYVELRDGNRRLIGRVTEIYSYDMDFFANPFTAGESNVFAPVELFKTLFAKAKSPDWKKAAVLAYLNTNGAGLKLAVVKVVGELNGGKLETPLKPFKVASPVYRVGRRALGELLKRNFSGNPMERPVKVGVLVGSGAEAFVDALELLSKHFLVLGTTGSGKSYFTKLFISRLLKVEPETGVYILDPHGEYREGLSAFGVDDIREVEFKDVLFPVYPSEVEELIKEEGFSALLTDRGVGKVNKAVISKAIKPSLRQTALRERSLRELFNQFEDVNGEKERLINAFASAEGQRELVGEVEDALKSDERVVIFSFKRVSEVSTRVNIAGLIMKELFEAAKEDGKRRLLILEEAHSFAPERGFGDASAGSSNLALVMARKIASEGRKFNLGLGVITQRPAQVSKYVLSQTNTQFMFRTINSSDLGAVSTFVEFAGEDIISLLPSLQTGMGVVCGLGAPFPLLVKVE